jgi:SmpA / OmlA family
MQYLLKHWWWLLGLGLAIPAVAWLRLHSPSLFSQEQCDLIQPGMTRAQVEAVLGKPPGDYSTGPLNTGFDCLPDLPEVKTMENWESDTGTVRVGFDGAGVVAWKTFRPALCSPIWLERIHAWLRLRTSPTEL